MLDENDVDVSIKLTKNALLLAGISIGEQRMKFLINLFYYFNLVWLYTDVIGEFFWLTDGIKLGKSLDELSMIAPCSTICLLATAKSLPIFFNKDTLETAVANLRNIHSKTLNNTESTDGSFERKTVVESLKFLDIIVYMLATLCAVVVVIFTSLPLMLMGYDYYHNGETDLKLPFLIQYFFDPYANTTVWGFVYFHQFWSSKYINLVVQCLCVTLPLALCIIVILIQTKLGAT